MTGASDATSVEASEAVAGTATDSEPDDGLVTVRYATGEPLMIDGIEVRVPLGTRVIPTRSQRDFAGDLPVAPVRPWAGYRSVL